MTSTVVDVERYAERFLRAAFVALAWLDGSAASPKRLGPTADARWRAFADAPTTVTEPDRLALLLRDAAVLHPAAYSARAVFALRGVTDDERFGLWSHELAKRETAPLFRAPPQVGPSALALFDAVAERWGASSAALSRNESLGPTTRLVLAGVAALRAACERFAQDRALDAGSQWTVVADEPSARHLAGVAAMALGSTRAPRVVTTREASQPRATLVTLGIDRVDRLWVSEDASACEQAAANALASAMGLKV